MIDAPPIALAIETSQRQASVALGRGGELIESRELPQLKRHNLELMPTVDALMCDHGMGPGDVAEVYVSVGPGSFTGLRVAVATGKVLALALPSIKLVAVPTLDVLAAQAPAEVEHVAVCLNTKKDTVYAATFSPIDEAGVRHPLAPPTLTTLADLLRDALPGTTLLGDPLPDVPDGAAVLDPALALPRAESVYRLGRRLADAGEHVDPHALMPIYAREPEAVSLWKQRHG
ncbi:MAG: tRNA (adenosine(37)-N6)-threonylcarbamoyltransferase complex dimerization subunit type 1 TsaB [Planctomycetota bacterium]